MQFVHLYNILIGNSNVLVAFICRSLQPWCLGGLVLYFSQATSSLNGTQPSTIDVISKDDAYWYAAGILGCSFGMLSCHISYVLYATQMGLRLRAVFRSMVYQKVNFSHSYIEE